MLINDRLSTILTQYAGEMAFVQRSHNIYSDCWRGYNVLDVIDFKHHRINHSKRFANQRNHINGIENFWNRAKRHMHKFNGVPRAHFGLHLKKCEWRFNNSDPTSQLLQLRQWVKHHLR